MKIRAMPCVKSGARSSMQCFWGFFTSNLIYFLIDIRVAFIIFRKRTRRIPRHASDFKEF